RAVALPHFDLLASSPAGMTAEARALAALLTENPGLPWVGFRDPALPVPRLFEEFAPCRVRVAGVRRGRLAGLVTRAECRKFGPRLHVGRLHRRVSGAHAVRLRRLLAALDREDFPADHSQALAELRRLT